MDLYLPSSDGGLTLQEMIDSDIKSDLDSLMQPDVLDNDFSYFDVTNLSSLDHDLDIKAFGTLFDPLDHMEDLEVPKERQDDMGSVSSKGHNSEDAVGSWMSLSCMANCNLENSIMVNPSVVLPPRTTAITNPDTVNSLGVNQSSKNTQVIGVKRTDDVLVKLQDIHNGKLTKVSDYMELTAESPLGRLPKTHFADGANQSNTTLVTTSTLTTPTMHPYVQHQNVSTTSSNVAGRNMLAFNVSKSVDHRNPSVHALPNKERLNRLKSTPKYRRSQTPEERVYPKPAYSYSCLIALALKNSATGSLPVSEIYNFMCEHFPYFRTAPNGWKNSVRHNLSLNKCFEKIEKPVVSGSNQRKGCLWALNPEKLHKMDEEVQKWSKKGLQEIKDAMSYPEALESLERGEMKFEPLSGASSCSEDEEEDEESALARLPKSEIVNASSQTLQPIKIINSLTAPVVVSAGQKVDARVLQATSNIRSGTQLNAGSVISLSQRTFRAGQVLQLHKRSPHSASGSPEQSDFILPDSTMAEINIQSDGAVLDDFGNDLELSSEMLLNAKDATTNFIVKKIDVSGSSSLGTLVYAPQSLSSQHHTPINRLLLSSAKLS